MKDEKSFKTNRKFKVAYAFTIVIALGALMFSKISTEKKNDDRSDFYQLQT